MTPTEHEGTVAVDTAAQKYAEVRAAAFGATSYSDAALRQAREVVLPIVWAALEALPDRRQAVLDVLAAEDPEPETYLSWCDDGITLLCERDECRTPGPCASGSCWHQETLTYRLTPAQAAAAVAAHVATHTQEPTP